MKNILFRADSSSTIGTGHIMRDLVLAEQFSDDNIIFATQELPCNINYKIEEKKYTIETLRSNDLNELDALIKQLKINMIVIDHYGINYDFEKQLKEKNPALSIMSLDDTYERHYCDVLLNHNMSADPKKYTDLVPKNCELRCGSRYTLLREEFRVEKLKEKMSQHHDTVIFIAMGGADTAGINIEVLNVLESFDNIRVNLVTTTANRRLQELQNYTESKGWIELHVNSNKIAKLMQESNLAIVTPSVTVNEVHFMELPFIAIKTADNQQDIYQYLRDNGYMVLEQFDTSTLKDLVCKILL